LRFLESGYASYPLPGVNVYDLKSTVFQARNEQALALDIHIHVVETAFDIRQGDRLNEPKRLLSTILRKGNPAVSNEEAGSN
jgi:hypothetical protein